MIQYVIQYSGEKQIEEFAMLSLTLIYKQSCAVFKALHYLNALPGLLKSSQGHLLLHIEEQ